MAADGVLLVTPEYNNGIPANSRGTLKGYDWLRDQLTNKESIDKVKALEPVARELDCSLAQLSIAWLLKNPNVSTVITGASRVEQIGENMKATEVAPRITPEIMKRIDDIFGYQPEEEED